MDQLLLLKVPQMGTTPGAPWELELILRATRILDLNLRLRGQIFWKSRTPVPHS
jgi:hypothetical protein